MKERPESDEFYYIGKDGMKHDAELHREMLDNPEADLYSRMQSMNDVIFKNNFNAELSMKLYGITEEDLKSELYQEVIEFRKEIGLPVFLYEQLKQPEPEKLIKTA